MPAHHGESAQVNQRRGFVQLFGFQVPPTSERVEALPGRRVFEEEEGGRPDEADQPQII